MDQDLKSLRSWNAIIVPYLRMKDLKVLSILRKPMAIALVQRCITWPHYRYLTVLG